MLMQQSTTAYTIMFFMTDSADHLTGKTGLSPTVTLSKAGAAFGSPSGAVTEVASGWYKVAGNATDTNTLGLLVLHATATGADATDMIVGEVVAFNPQVNFSTNAAAGASGGVLISGSNSGTTTLGALTITGATTHTGNVVFSDGITVSAPSTTNRAGLSIAGNGTGAGILATGGATGIGISAVGGSTSGSAIKATGTAGNAIALELVGQGSAQGLKTTGGATGNGASFIGGGTSGHGIQCTVTSGNEIDADLTGNVTGNLSGSVGSVTATVSANVTQFGGNAGTFASGIPSVNTIQWRGTQPAALSNTFVQCSLQETAAGVITATSIAADAIGASELAADAATEIATAVGALIVESQGSYTLKQASALTLSAVLGVTSGGTFKTPDGVATRAAVTYSGNDRTASTLTP